MILTRLQYGHSRACGLAWYTCAFGRHRPRFKSGQAHFNLCVFYDVPLPVYVFRLLFVCHANVCRSPLCEFVMKKIVSDRGMSDGFLIESAGTDPDEGCDIWFRSKEVMDANGIPWESRSARQLVPEEYGDWDMFVVMDYSNLEDAKAILGGDPEGKVRLLLRDRAVGDPYFHGDFNRSFAEIERGCISLLGDILQITRDRTGSD